MLQDVVKKTTCNYLNISMLYLLHLLHTFCALFYVNKNKKNAIND